MIDLPEPPTSVADVALAQEIRQYIRGQKSPIDVAVKFMSNPRILGAILTAPAILSGLSATEQNLMRKRARAALHPEQAQMQEWLMKARDELREGRHDAQAYWSCRIRRRRLLALRCRQGAIHPISWRPLLACEGHRYSSVTCPNRRSRCLSLSLPISKSVVRLNSTEPAWPNAFQSPCARCGATLRPPLTPAESVLTLVTSEPKQPPLSMRE